jgi:hypothetical protein
LNRKLRTAGFERTRAGYMFPGTSAEDVANAAKLKILAKKNPKLKKPEEPLAMGIKPMDKSGEVTVDFN